MVLAGADVLRRFGGDDLGGGDVARAHGDRFARGDLQVVDVAGLDVEALATALVGVDLQLQRVVEDFAGGRSL